MCVSASVSCSRSCPLTSAGFRSCGVPPGSILLSSGFATFSICFPSHVSHNALLPEVVLASAPVPICSKIWEVCFDVNTVLDDSPINSGGATRSRQCSLLGGATRTRSDAATCVLPSDATCTRHDDAISSKRLTVPCDSDFLCASLIRDGLASQHVCSPTTQCPWSVLLLSEVCSDMHAEFSSLPGVCSARFSSVSTISLLKSLFQLLPWMPARHAASVFHLSRRLPVAFVTSVGVSFDSSFSLHSLVMSSTCSPFDSHSDPCGLHLTPLHELGFSLISPPYHVV